MVRRGAGEERCVRRGEGWGGRIEVGKAKGRGNVEGCGGRGEAMGVGQLKLDYL